MTIERENDPSLLEDRSYRFIKDASWDEVFDFWREAEAHQQSWIDYAKSLGFEGWEQWRINYVEAFGLKNRKWQIYKLEHPSETVADFWGGPFPGWIKNQYDGKSTRQFSWLADQETIQNNDKIKAIIKEFPKQTTLIALLFDQGIVIVEGMHRSSALAIADKRSINVESDVYVAIADARGEELPNLETYKKDIIKKITE